METRSEENSIENATFYVETELKKPRRKCQLKKTVNPVKHMESSFKLNFHQIE